MTITTTLADLAHTCRQRAASLLESADSAEDLAREYSHRGNGPANRFREEAADWQALCDLAEYEIVHPDRLVEAARRLVARLDRP